MPAPSAPGPGPSLALRRAYRKAGPHTWALIRELYLAGVPAAELSVQFDVSVHTVRKRATRDGWSRKAQAAAIPTLRLPPGAHFAAIPAAGGEAPAVAAPGPYDDDEEADPLEAAQTVLRRAAAAAEAGRLGQAAEGVKLAEGLAKAATALGLGGRNRAGRRGRDDDDDEPDDGYGDLSQAQVAQMRVLEAMSDEEIERLRETVAERMDRYGAEEVPMKSWEHFTRDSALEILQRIADTGEWDPPYLSPRPRRG